MFQLRLLSASSVVFLLLAIGSPAPAQSPSDEHAPARVVVVLRADLVDLPERVTGPQPWASGVPDLDVLLERLHVREMVRVIRGGGSAHRDPSLFHALGLDRHYVIELEPGSDETTARDELARSPLVASTRLDGIAHIAERPNDPLYGQQWNHHVAIGSLDPDIDTDLAWDVGARGAGVVVAVLDTGCELTHPDLAGAFVAGYDFINFDSNASDDHSHGTGVAGIIAARGNNGIGLAGVAWGASVMPVKVLDSTGSGPWSAVASGITWAADNGAKIVNLSLGANAYDAGVEAALAYATGLDVLCIAASGNGNAGVVFFPASAANCMAIGGSDMQNQRVVLGQFSGSNYGPQLDLVAPGVSITTTALSAGYNNNFTGTSAAAPHVAGVAALVRGLAPSLNQGKVRDILLDSAEDQVGPGAEDTPGFDVYFGRGKLSANRAVLAVHPQATRRLNLKPEGQQTLATNYYSSIAASSDGRYVTFDSLASDLMAGDTNGNADVFVLDRMSGITLLASQGMGAAWPNLQSYRPSISDDGRWISFASVASNLTGGDFNGRYDIFVWDNFAHVMQLVSQSTSGTQGNLDSLLAVISGNGRYIAFQSEANNLVSSDTNNWADVFVRDRDTDGDGVFDEPGMVSTVRVSVGPGGVQGNSESGDGGIAISQGGTQVVFNSYSTNLVAGSSIFQHIYARNLATQTTTLISDGACGYQGGMLPALSASGRYAAYQTDTNPAQVVLVDRDTDNDGVFDEIGATSCEIASQGVSGSGSASSSAPSLSDDARYVSFTSWATNLVSGDSNAAADIYVRDRQLGVTERVSISTALAQSNGPSAGSVLTSTGHEVFFDSDATNLVPGDTNGDADVFVRELFQIDLLATSFCFCNGGASPPPCGTPTSAPQGCRNTTGVGAILTASGSSNISRNDLALTGTQLPPFRNALMFMGGGLINGNQGGVLGDGRMCVGTGGIGTFRFPLLTSNALGTVSIGPGVAGSSLSLFPSTGYITAGATWNFQCWYRDSGGPCGTGTNMTSAVAVTFVP